MIEYDGTPQRQEPLTENQSVLDQVDQYITDHNGGRTAIAATTSTTAPERTIQDLDFEVGLESRDSDPDTSGTGPEYGSSNPHQMPFHFDLDMASTNPGLPESRLVRPDVVFSPVISPVVAPIQGSAHHHHHHHNLHNHSQFQQPSLPQSQPYSQQHSSSYSGRHHSVGTASTANTPLLRSQAPGSVHTSKPQFSPLSSPAIDALDNLAALKRVSSSSSSRGRKTPLSTPALTATTVSTSSINGLPSSSTGTVTTGSKVVKSSPQLARKRPVVPTYGRRKSGLPSNWDEMFALPDSSIPPPPLPPAAAATFAQSQPSQQQLEDIPHPRPTSSISSTRTQNSSNSTVPLSSLDLEFDHFDHPQPESHDSGSLAQTHYPKVILPSTSFQSGQSPGRGQPSVMGSHSNTNGNHNVIVASESPVIKAKNPSPSYPAPVITRKTSAGSITIRATPELNPLRKSSKSSLDDKEDEDISMRDLDEMLRNGGGGEQHRKEVHKAAEQGRRNRLNNALTELHALIPAELKGSTLVPSKATTVELACVYIRELVARGANSSDKM
ncbi:LAFA_0D13608g1_1 [Lachancea sp. 'fantastica']|nr:LAFA_0D13608g1_1 [Lachancea sp. 'fantastica']